MPKQSAPRPPRRERISSEHVVLGRMLWFARRKKQGCHASNLTLCHVETDPDSPRFSVRHLRRIQRRLQARGEILFAGLTANGNLIWFEPGERYDGGKVPLSSSRSTGHLWPTEAARQLIDAPPAEAKRVEIQGYPIDRKILDDFGDEQVAFVISRILEARKGDLAGIKYKAKYLRAVCRKLLDKVRPQAAERRSEASKLADEAEWEAQPPEFRETLEQLLGQAVGAPDGVPAAPAQTAEGAAESVSPHRPEQPGSVAEAISYWLAFRRPEIASKTYDYYLGKARNLKALLGDKQLAKLARKDVQDYIAKRRAEVKEQTVNMELDVLKQVLREAEQHSKINPSVRQSIPKHLRVRDKREGRPLSFEEYEKLRAKLPPHRQAYLDVGVYSGARRSEIEGMKLSDVDFRKEELKIRGTKTKEANRVIPLPLQIAELARNHPGGPLVGRWHNSWTELGEACAAAGIQRRSVLDFRHTFASWLVNAPSCKNLDIAKLLGHRNTKMLEAVYGHPDEAALRQVISCLPARAPPIGTPTRAPPDSPPQSDA